MRFNTFVILLLSIYLYSCNGKNENFLEFKEFHKPTPLAHSICQINSDDLLDPIRIDKVDSFLLIGNGWGSFGISVFDLNSFSFIKHFIQKGNGPEEFPGGYPGITDVGENFFDLFDNAKKRLYRYYLPDVLNDESLREVILDVNFINNPILLLNSLDDNFFIATGGFDNGRYSIVNKSQKTYNEYLNYPDSSSSKINFSNKYMGYQGILKLSPSKKRFIYIPLLGEIIEIYELKNRKPHLIKSYYKSLPKYEQTGNEIGFDRSTINGFQYAYVTEKNIYLLHSGISVKDKIDNQSQGSNCLLIFDWNGNPQKRYELDIPIVTMCTDNDETIYAIAYIEGLPKVVEFNI